MGALKEGSNGAFASSIIAASKFICQLNKKGFRLDNKKNLFLA